MYVSMCTRVLYRSGVGGMYGMGWCVWCGVVCMVWGGVYGVGWGGHVSVDKYCITTFLK